jgi:hypothetical protein
MKFDDLAPVLVFALVVVMIIVKQLLSHQRQMTALIHRVDQQQTPNHDSLKMQQDMMDLKQLVHQQAIAIDNLSGKLDSVANSNPVQERLTNTQ